jgi:hypothetical protein
MTEMILVDGEEIPITKGMLNWASFQLEQQAKRIDEQRRKSYDEFGTYLR